MTNPIMRTQNFHDEARGRACHHLVWCPGCDEVHSPTTSIGEEYSGPIWNWNQSEDKPTFSPSLLVHLSDTKKCHSFIVDGQWQFLTDSWHPLAGQTVDMVPIPDWLVK